MTVTAPSDTEVEWTDEQARELERFLDDLNLAASGLAVRMERMHGLMQDIIGDLRGARGVTQSGVLEEKAVALA